MQNEDLVQHLNQLITMCKDSEQGYRTAAEEVRKMGLKTLLHQHAQQRATMRAELQEQVLQLGGQPIEDGSLLGKIHRVWMEVTTTFVDKDESFVLGECLRGEQSFLDYYDDKLSNEIPDDLKELLQQQKDKISSAIQGLQTSQRQVEKTQV